MRLTNLEQHKQSTQAGHSVLKAIAHTRGKVLHKYTEENQ